MVFAHFFCLSLDNENVYKTIFWLTYHLIPFQVLIFCSLGNLYSLDKEICGCEIFLSGHLRIFFTEIMEFIILRFCRSYSLNKYDWGVYASL